MRVAVFALIVLLSIASCLTAVTSARAEIHVWVGHNKPAIRLTNEGSTLLYAGNIDGAITSLNKAIELDPKMWPAYLTRSEAFLKQRKWQRALQDLNEAARLKPDFYQIYFVRAAVNIALHEYHRALQDLNESARLKPNHAQTYAVRGVVYVFLHNPAAALADLDAALRHSRGIKDKALMFNTRAWIRATATDPALRDGRQALADAKRASKMTGEKDASTLDTVAAAYAETGDFTSAVGVERQALSIGNIPNDLATELRKHLAAFERHEPIRDDLLRFASPDRVQLTQ